MSDRQQSRRQSREVSDERVLSHVGQPHSGSVGPNADHLMTIAVCLNASSNYCVLSRLPWGSICENLLFDHDERENKDGPAAIFSAVKALRYTEHAELADALAYEIDGKAACDQACDLVDKSGREAVLWTTHNHLRTCQTVAVGTYRKSQGNAAPTAESMKQFCVSHPRYSHLKNVELLNNGTTRNVKEWGKWVPVYDIGHDPEDKLRIVFPLASSIPLKDGSIGIDGFKQLYHLHGQRVFDDRYSRESASPARLHYLASHRPAAEHKIVHFRGSLTDWCADWSAIQPKLESERCIQRDRREARLKLPSTGLDELHRVLESIPPDLTYPEWFRVLAAIHHETAGSDDGAVLAHGWSEHDPRYQCDQVQRIWDCLSANHSSPATMGSLVKLAKQHDPDYCPAADVDVAWLEEFV